ncbi:hydrolase [Streptomyces purpureus]|uniref:Hydrolase n=1 Tax=Streptomyces purpureus TaxID=1951 RepID=A0A918GYL8_9ACTN|nr:hydrolase [Streptomyces purpureus]
MTVRPAAVTAAAGCAVTALLTAGVLLAPASPPEAPASSPNPVAPAGAQRQADDAPGGPLVIAHRGASAYAPENTLAAVDEARVMGFTWVENDVQRTRDGQLVVMHDESLARTTDVEQRFPGRSPWKVKDFTAAEIARLDAGSWFGSRWAGARVPTLAQYLDRVERNGQNLLLEIKKPELYPGIEGDTLRVLGERGWLDRHHVAERLVVQSFGADTVRAVHDRRPDVVTGFLGTPKVSELPAYARFTDQINPSHTTIDAAYVAAVHRLKGAHGWPLQVSTWTVNDAAAARRVAGYGVDAIITNKPDVVQEATG